MDVRVAVRTALVAAIRARITDTSVGVDRAFPGNDLKPDHVYIDRVTGSGSLPFIQAGRQEREDEFRVLVQFQAARPGRTSEDAESSCASMRENAELAIAEAQLSGGLLHTVEFLEIVNLGEKNGPDAEPTAEGWIAFADLEVVCTARIQ